MGAIHFSIDTDLVKFLAGHLPFEVFVETGTYKGDSIERVKPYFNRFYSVELSEDYYNISKNRFANDSLVQIIHGDAVDFLARLMSDIRGKSVLYWLDSHWCDAQATEGKTSQCTLLDELKAIDTLNKDSVVLIDDARLFLSPPGVPHDHSQWPDLKEIISILYEKSSCHELMVLNDIIVYFPEQIKEQVRGFGHQNGVDWLKVADMFRQTGHVIAELEAKEKEIESVIIENKLLAKEIQVKESEINLKQHEINNISSVAEQRLYIIQQFESAKESMLSGFKTEIDVLREVIDEKQNQIDEKQNHIKTIDALIIEKDRFLGKVEEIAEARLQVIREQENAIYSLRKRRVKELIKLWLQPRLGALYHYPPRLLKIPKKYYKEQKKSIPKGGWPLISIVTPSYNQADFIERTIQSVFQQQYPKLEYLIQDGGSDDGTVEILKKYDDRLKQWESVADEGQSDALNKCFFHATGNVMSYLNSDDLLLPGALHYVAHYFVKHPEVDVVYGHRVLVDEYDQEIGRWVMPPHDNDVLSWADYIPQETMFWRREIWEKAGGFIDKNFKFAMDWDLILRFREAGAKIIRLPRFLGAFRVHPHQKTSAEISDQGEKEMRRLRERCHGRVVSEAEISQNIKKYLFRHVIHQKLYRAGLFNY